MKFGDLVSISKREKTKQVSLTLKKRILKKSGISMKDLLELNVSKLKKK